MSDQPKWLWGFVLHNLTLRDSLESTERHLAIVPHNDDRLPPIVANSPLGRNLIENFTDELGLPRSPSILLIREDSPPTVKHIDAVVSFRNLIALSCITYSWQQSIRGPNAWGTLYSDCFNFYPTTLAADGIHVRTISSAMNGFGQPKEIRGQTSPGLSSTASFSKVEFDRSFVHLLMIVWNELYIGQRRFEHDATTLFRSLQIAYHAAAMPMGNERSIHDYGSRIALWVSACEILAHKMDGNGYSHASFNTVIELLEKHRWSKAELVDRKYRHNLTLIGQLYSDLNKARNDFLHGNPVSYDSLFPFGNKQRPPLPHLAPLIYKTVLLCYLERFDFLPKRKIPEIDDPAFDRMFLEGCENHLFEKAILSALEDKVP